MERDVIHQLYMRYERELYFYIFSLTQNQELAQDLLHETFLKAILAMPDSIQNMRAWLYQVAKNLTYNYLKKQSRVDLTSEEIEIPIEDDALSHIIDQERNRKLYEAILKLSVRKREVLTMQYFGQLSMKEIAEVLKITLENVKVLSYRAKRELRQYLEGEEL